MTRYRPFLLMLLALMALLAPSTGAVLHAAASGVVVTAADAGADAPAYTPCETRGGKRIMSCSADLGVLVSATNAPVPKTSEVRALMANPMHRILTPAAEPPPPRRI